MGSLILEVLSTQAEYRSLTTISKHHQPFSEKMSSLSFKVTMALGTQYVHNKRLLNE